MTRYAVLLQTDENRVIIKENTVARTTFWYVTYIPSYLTLPNPSKLWEISQAVIRSNVGRHWVDEYR